jgi:hypothetical protein
MNCASDKRVKITILLIVIGQFTLSFRTARADQLDDDIAQIQYRCSYSKGTTNKRTTRSWVSRELEDSYRAIIITAILHNAVKSFGYGKTIADAMDEPNIVDPVKLVAPMVGEMAVEWSGAGIAVGTLAYADWLVLHPNGGVLTTDDIDNDGYILTSLSPDEMKEYGESDPKLQSRIHKAASQISNDCKTSSTISDAQYSAAVIDTQISSKAQGSLTGPKSPIDWVYGTSMN